MLPSVKSEAFFCHMSHVTFLRGERHILNSFPIKSWMESKTFVFITEKTDIYQWCPKNAIRHETIPIHN